MHKTILVFFSPQIHNFFIAVFQLSSYVLKIFFLLKNVPLFLDFIFLLSRIFTGTMAFPPCRWFIVKRTELFYTPTQTLRAQRKFFHICQKQQSQWSWQGHWKPSNNSQPIYNWRFFIELFWVLLYIISARNQSD